MSLWSISDDLYQVINGGMVVDESTGEILFDSDNLDELEASFDDKLEACGLFVKNLDSDAAALKAEEKALKERREAKERKAESLRSYMVRCMDQAGRRKMETPRVALGLRKSTAVDVFSECDVPEEFTAVKTERRVNKALVMKALKKGEEVPGCAIVERESLQLK